MRFIPGRMRGRGRGQNAIILNPGGAFMALGLGTALTYTLAPAFMGFVMGVLAARRAWSPELNAGDKSRLWVLHATMVTGMLFSLVISFIAAPRDVATMPLLVLGVVAALVAVLQGATIGATFERVRVDPSQFGRVLIRVVLPETVLVLAFIYANLQVGAA